jgi:hypothetical protein
MVSSFFMENTANQSRQERKIGKGFYCYSKDGKKLCGNDDCMKLNFRDTNPKFTGKGKQGAF